MLGAASPLVFALRDGRPIFAKRLRRLLRKCQIAAVPHGFRSSFRDWAAEETDHPREVVEAALAHVVGNKVDAAYRRTDLFERRRRLMDDWATYLAGERGTRRPHRSDDPAGLVIGSVASRVAHVSQPTLWGHASRVPGRGWRGGCAPSDPPNGNGTSWTLDAGGGLAPLPSRRRVLMADRRTVAAGRFVAENH